MVALSPVVAQHFWSLCEWAHTAWLIQKAFEEDPRTEAICRAGHAWLIDNLSTMSVEYVLLQMAKLHDPACQQGRLNLTLEYVLEYGGWDQDTETELRGLLAQLKSLFDQLRLARNRIIAHHDLATILAGQPQGGFQAGLDIEYFAQLERFASLVREKAVGEPLEFGYHARTDVMFMLSALSKSCPPDA